MTKLMSAFANLANPSVHLYWTLIKASNTFAKKRVSCQWDWAAVAAAHPSPSPDEEVRTLALAGKAYLTVQVQQNNKNQQDCFFGLLDNEIANDPSPFAASLDCWCEHQLECGKSPLGCGFLTRAHALQHTERWPLHHWLVSQSHL
jgi:hypothetical protein